MPTKGSPRPSGGPLRPRFPTCPIPMKGLHLRAAAFLVPVLWLGCGCASTPRPPAMPAWSAVAAEATPASAALAADGVRVPSDVRKNEVRVPSDTQDDQIRVPRDKHDDRIRIPREDEEAKELWQAQGLYLGGALITSQPMGDFDGDTAYFGPTDIVIVPDLDVGAGVGAYLSYRWRMNEILLQYSITEHDGDFSGSPRDHDTTFYDIDLNWRHYFWEHSPLQPYGLLGVGWSLAETDDGSTDQATMSVFEDSEQEDGIAVNVGAGVAFHTLPWVTFWGQGVYRFVRYETSDGIDGEISNTPDVDGDGWNVSAGAAIRLLPPRD